MKTPARALQHRVGELGSGRLRLLPGTFDGQSRAFAVPSGSSSRAPIGRQILRITNGVGWQALTAR